MLVIPVQSLSSCWQGSWHMERRSAFDRAYTRYYRLRHFTTTYCNCLFGPRLLPIASSVSGHHGSGGCAGIKTPHNRWVWGCLKLCWVLHNSYTATGTIRSPLEAVDGKGPGLDLDFLAIKLQLVPSTVDLMRGTSNFNRSGALADSQSIIVRLKQQIIDSDFTTKARHNHQLTYNAKRVKNV